MDPIQLRLLGPPTAVRGDGTPISARALPLAILGYIAMQGTGVSREDLAALFWPKSDPPRARQSLRQALVIVREALGKDLLQEDKGTLHVQPGVLQLDVNFFTAYLNDGRLTEALDLWRGHFLDGVSSRGGWELEEWIDKHRSRFERLLGLAAKQHGDRRLRDNRPELAISEVERVATLLPFGDELTYTLVRLLAASGRDLEASALISERVRPDDPESADALVTEVEALGRAAREERLEAAAETPSWTSRFRSLRGLVAIPVLLLALWLGSWVGDRNLERRLDQKVLLFCSAQATDDGGRQLYRTSMNGDVIHRVTSDRVCVVVADTARGIIYGSADTEGANMLVQYSLLPGNPIAEWVAEGLAPELRGVDFSIGGPSITGDGTLLFTGVDSTGNWDIYALAAGTDTPTRLTSDPARDYQATVDPSGESVVVFVSERSGHADLYSVELDGTALTQLTDHPLYDAGPWLRGDTVLFVRGLGRLEEDGNMELFFLLRSSGTEIQITNNDWNDDQVSWSPDGRMLCWQSEEDGHYQSEITTLTLGSSVPVNTTNHVGRDAGCEWTGIDDVLIFESYRTGHVELFRSRRGGSDVRQLTNYDAHVGFPVVVPKSLFDGGAGSGN